MVELAEALEQLRPVMQKTQDETNVLVAEIKKQEVQATAAQEAMEKEKMEAGKETEEAHEMRDLCDKELAAVRPSPIDISEEFFLIYLHFSMRWYDWFAQLSLPTVRAAVLNLGNPCFRFAVVPVTVLHWANEHMVP